MRILGLIGGISWVSTADYYSYINRGINKQLGGLNFAHCIIHSFNYADIVKNNESENWDGTLKMLTEAAQSLQNSGAEAIVLCANTMHLVADALAGNVDIPIIHIAEATATEITKHNMVKVGLLGTRFTMERDFFKNKLQDRGITAIIPDDEERKFIHNTIGDELGKGIIKHETRDYYIAVINKLVTQGAQGVILGCTEIPMLIKATDVNVPLFDTALIHAKAAVEFALS